ncbi:MAG: SDR family oxidoreductase [Methylococcales bacterium]|nr:SDR family oxidoreductase [Methylococcales bacterium]
MPNASILKNKTILITGANGFVGKALCESLAHQSYKIIAAVRKIDEASNKAHQIAIEEINADTDWTSALSGVDTVIHLAARVHVMHDIASDAQTAYRNVNVEGTLQLAKSAVKAGVKRFIFLSSIKVNGEGTEPNRPYTPEDEPAPVDPYGVSKLEAEIALRQLANDTGLEVVIIRPPLIYGPGVKANFKNMMSFLNKSIPLPLGAINNKRSLVALDNLIDLISCCINHPAAANETFLVSDGLDVSTPELLRSMAKALDKKALLIPIPSSLLQAVAVIIGKKAFAQRLCSSLQVDVSKTYKLLNWTPAIKMDAALAKTALFYKNNLSN